MSDKEILNKEETRREFLSRVLTTAAYSAPVLMSFSMVPRMASGVEVKTSNQRDIDLLKKLDGSGGDINDIVNNHKNYKAKWTQVAGSADGISISSTGAVWVKNAAGDVFYRDFSKKTWTHLRNVKATQIAAGVGSKAYHIGADGKTMYKGGINGWQKLPGAASFIAAGPDGALWSLSKSKVGRGGHAIYRWEGNNWKRIPGEATVLSAGANGIIYAVNALGDMYRMKKGETKWTKLPGKAADISTAGPVVWHLSQNVVGRGGHAIYRSVDEGQTWLRVAGELRDIEATVSGNAWGVNLSFNIVNGDPKGSKATPGKIKLR